MTYRLSLALLALALLAPNSPAAFRLLENFNTLTPGSINGQHGWVSSGTGDGRVVSDPALPGNQVLAVTNTSGNVYCALGSLAISNQNTGTLYFRLLWPGTAIHAYIGLTDVTTPAGGGSTGDYETQVGADTAASGTLKVRDATTYNTLTNLQSNTWYSIWMVHRNPNDLYSLYIQGGAFTTQTQLKDTSGQTWFTFRNTSGDGFNTNSSPVSSNHLITFAVKSGSSHVGPYYIDDVYLDPTNQNLSIPLPDVTPPAVSTILPQPGSTSAALTSVTVVFSEPVIGVAATNLLVNGAFATNAAGSGTTWTWQFLQPPPGPVTVAWAAGQKISDLAFNAFVPATNSWTYTLLAPDSTPPYVLASSPPANATVSTLTLVTVTFSEPVTGLQPDDLLLSGKPALAVSNNAVTYTFTFTQPPQGVADVRFDSAHGITDLAGNRLDETAPANRWSYTVIDTTPPTVVQIAPAPGATVTRLTSTKVIFSEPVAGVDAADLLINGVAATNVSGFGLGPYVFTFPQPALGGVSLAWRSDHGIHDLSPQANAFAGGSWNLSLAVSNAAGQVVLNEFLASNISTNGLRDEDGALSDWIELFNPGSTAVNLTGWALTDDAGQLNKWVFPAATLNPGQFLVVFASGKDRRPAGGVSPLHTSFTLSAYGSYLALCPPEFPAVPSVEFSPAYPEQRNDYSYGLNSLSQWSYFAVPTPGAPNGDSSITNTLDLVHFSSGHGLFNAPFQVILTPPVPDATIRYTTDGSVPTDVNGLDYTAPLTVTTTTALRAVAFRPGSLPSRVATVSYVFPEAVLSQPTYPPGFPITTTWSTYGWWYSDYGVTPAVVYDPRYQNTLVNDLQAVPTLSVVMNVEDIFGAANGIYTHAANYGPLWERACSIELINPDGSKGFQVDAGIQMHGGGSRLRTLKHPFRLQFKGMYGPTKLNYQFFPDSPVQEFDGIDLRSDYNNHWSHGSDASQRARGTMVRDPWSKDVHRSMGDLDGHGRYVHLYINGLYWGVYNACERPDASFAASYLGGQPADYDAYNGTGTQLVDGTADAHNAMLAVKNLQILSQYDFLKQYLDVEDYAGYMLLHIYSANQDWGNSKNWACARKREPGAGFKYFCWDDERVMEGANQTPMGVGSVANLNLVSPDGLQSNLVASAEYRLLFADLVQKNFFNDGVLTSNSLTAAWRTRAAQIDRAIVGESARWGAMMTTTGAPGSQPFSPLPYPSYVAWAPYTRDANWLGAQGWLFTNYFPAREPVVLSQLRTVGLYPTNVMAPVWNQFGGRVPSGFALTMTATNSVYYTTNGTDPRVYGSGAIAASAVKYTNSAPLVLRASTLVKARGLQGTNWSGLVEATFLVQERASPLRISELMYNPVGGSTYEFLELLNTSGTAIDLSGCSFDGVIFIFPPGSSIDAGQRLVLANNNSPGLWAGRYPGASVAGWYGGSLDNAGERIALLDPLGETLFSVTYSPTNGWPSQAAGHGFSLEMIDPDADANDPANWRASSALNGSPGQPAGLPPASDVLLNEIMAWNVSAVTNAGTVADWIELYNSGAGDVNLGGFSLSDDGNPRKYVLPSTNLPPGGFLVLWCDAATNTTPGLHTGFGLGRRGGDVFLYDASTNRLDAVGYGPQVPDYSLGRIGAAWQLTTPTPGNANAAAALASSTNLVLNEWLANSAPGENDWIELFNQAASAPVALHGICLGTASATCQLRALSFIPPRGWLQLIADKNPGPAHLDFKLPATGGTNFLYDEFGALVDRITYGPQVEGVSQGRLPDGSPNITNFVLSPSPGASNYIAAYSGPYLNEICALNRTVLTNAAGHTPDWVELYNPTAAAYPLAGFALGRSANTAAAWSFPAGASVPGYGYLLVQFDNDRPASTNLEAELTTGQSLSGDGGAVYLFNPQGLVLDAVSFGPQPPDFTIGRTGNLWTLLAAPTPGTANAALALLGDPSTLRINEWLAAPAPGQSEFFELFNPDLLPVDLSGLFVTDDLSIAGLTQSAIPPLSFIAPSGFTTFIADGHASGGPNHVAFKASALGESLRLYGTQSGIIDTVVFGQQSLGVSEGRIPDGGSLVVSYSCATPGSSNGLSTLHFDLQPQSQFVLAGGTAGLSASASGFGLLSYQWLHNGLPVALATNRMLLLAGVQAADTGAYVVVVSNACGVITSAVATVTLVLPPQIAVPDVGSNGFRFTLSGQPGSSYAIEKSTNLVNWSVLSTNTATNGAITILDPAATNSSPGFYRARFVP